MRECTQCGGPNETKGRYAQFCSAECRATSRLEPETPRAAEPEDSYPLADVVRRELEAAGVLDTALGQQAVTIAVRMADAAATALAPLSKELRSVMAAATRGAETEADPVDELKLRRDRKSG